MRGPMWRMVPHWVSRHKKTSNQKRYQIDLRWLQESLQARSFGILLLGLACKNNWIRYGGIGFIRQESWCIDHGNEEIGSTAYQDDPMEISSKGHAEESMWDKWVRSTRSRTSPLWTIFTITLVAQRPSRSCNFTQVGPYGSQRIMIICIFIMYISQLWWFHDVSLQYC